MQSTSALALKKRFDLNICLTFGCPNIDELVGHIPSSGITEISGEAGCGKSQMCMHLSLQCGLKPIFGGIDGATAYMCCGEGEFPVRRLSQMANAVSSYVNNTSAVSNDDITVMKDKVTASQLLENIFIEHINNYEDLIESLVRK